MIEKIDEKWFGTKNLYFKDEGPVSAGRVTHVFSVKSKHNGSFIGNIRWLATWRQYTFNPCNCILNKDYLRELANFCEERTKDRTADRMAERNK